MIELSPILFEPYLKSVIWGGNKICRYKNIDQTEHNIGESWEISALPGHESVVSDGVYKGLTISELIDRFGVELLGEKVVAKYGLTFPLLIKIIDAADNLSVQVHPDDELATIRHNCLGKTEMWYIIDSEKNAKIYAGLNTEMTPDEYSMRIADGTFYETIAIHDSRPGDVFFLPAGRVHAIGAGNLLAEIQEASDITYRIYDYDRRDACGNLRDLHTDLAKDAIDFSVCGDYRIPRRSDSDLDCEIINCEHFRVNRIIVNGVWKPELNTDSFSVIMCIDGSVCLTFPTGKMKLQKGHTLLIPAALTDLTLIGYGTILHSTI